MNGSTLTITMPQESQHIAVANIITVRYCLNVIIHKSSQFGLLSIVPVFNMFFKHTFYAKYLILSTSLLPSFSFIFSTIVA